MIEKLRVVIPVNGMPNKLECIKALRMLSDLTLMDAKTMSETAGGHVIHLRPSFFDPSHDASGTLDAICDILKRNNILVSGFEQVIIDQLRKLSILAIEQGHEELGQEILQLIVAEKLRKGYIK